MLKPSHAVVVGGSMAGLLAVRARFDHCPRVTMLKRDPIPPAGERREGVPQSRQPHVLLAGGLRALAAFLPQYTKGTVQAIRILGLVLLVVALPLRARAQFGPPPPQNPAAAVNGVATQHGDTAASDTTPFPGPGAQAVLAVHIPLLGVCPSVLIASDGFPIAVCTQIVNQTPAVYLLDPATGLPLASLQLARGSLFGGVYPYLDHEDQLVVVDGDHELLWIGHYQTALGLWQLTVEHSLSLAAAITDSCGSVACDSVVGLAPGYDGRIWFATGAGTVGVVDVTTEAVATVVLRAGERVSNSIATAPEGTAVVTDQTLYLLSTDAIGTPRIDWRAPYDRGPARKPGQLSHGSGSIPTFFGPATGTEYVAITDNASPLEHLLIYRTAGAPSPVCSLVLPHPTGKGSENSPIGSGRSVFVASTYGYPYPALPAEAGPSDPPAAPITGGMTRVDLTADGTGCHPVWTNRVRSAAVPKLSLADQLIYTTERSTLLGTGIPTPLDAYQYTVIDPDTGSGVAQQTIAIGADTLQLAGTIAPGRVLYQGTFGGLLRITGLH